MCIRVRAGVWASASNLLERRKFRALFELSGWTGRAGRPSFTAMPTAHLIRRVHFNAAHRYYRPEWSETENQRVFGACANPHGHGHNYQLEVTIAGEIDSQTGFSADLTQVDALLRREVVERFDHQHLNHAVPEF